MSIHGHDPAFRPRRILAGDIGGTHSRLAIFSHDAGDLELLQQQTYPSLEHDGLSEVLSVFLEGQREQVDAACLGLPAPIQAGIVYPLPNLPWEIDRDRVLQAVGTDRLVLINDVEASAAGIQGLSDSEQACLQRGQADPVGNRIVISVGTGLGVSAITPSGRIIPTEAGHTSFSPRCELDFKLMMRLQAEFGHVSWERVASGPALPRIHAMLAPNASTALEPHEIAARAAVDPVCRQAVDIIRDYIGAAAGNIALNLMATGGIYLTGGVASNVIGPDSAGPFLEAFNNKGRMRGFLERIPVYVVKEEGLALRGAAKRAVALLASQDDEG